MDDYYVEKMKRGLIFSRHNIDPNLPYTSIDMKSGEPIDMPGNVSWWSALSHRYRDADEQEEYLTSGCVDRVLPPKGGEDEQSQKKNAA